MKITFNDNNVLPNQLQNKSGNLSQTLFNNSMKSTSPSAVVSKSLEKNPPNMWNSLEVNNDELKRYNGLSNEFGLFMKQANLAEYYQKNPWGVLEHSKKYGYKGPQPGGTINMNYSEL